MVKNFKVAKILISIVTISILITSCAPSNKESSNENSTLMLENKKLEKRIEELETLLANTEKQSASETDKMVNKPNSNIKLREAEIFLYDHYMDSNDCLWRPSYGPTASLNAFAINMDSNLTIIEQDENYTKVEIRGVIPTWYIMNTTNKSETMYISEDMYIIKDSKVYLSPREKKLVNNFSRGNAVHVKYEWKDWYYVSLYRQYDSNAIINGWVRKVNLGNLNMLPTLVNVDVRIKQNSTVDNNGESLVIENNTTWGTIIEETDDTYSISLPGAWSVEVNKTDVEFIDNNK